MHINILMLNCKIEKKNKSKKQKQKQKQKQYKTEISDGTSPFTILTHEQ